MEHDDPLPPLGPDQMANWRAHLKNCMADWERRRVNEGYKAETVARLNKPGAIYAGVAAELGLTAMQVKTWYLERAAAGSERL